MAELLERVKLNLLVNGDGIVENFKNNSLFFYEKYNQSSPDVEAISITNIYPGGFYFFHYLDDSNWMKYSPVVAIIAINLFFVLFAKGLRRASTIVNLFLLITIFYSRWKEERRRKKLEKKFLRIFEIKRDW